VSRHYAATGRLGSGALPHPQSAFLQPGRVLLLAARSALYQSIQQSVSKLESTPEKIDLELLEERDSDDRQTDKLKHKQTQRP